jgi:hypothetical protein
MPSANGTLCILLRLFYASFRLGNAQQKRALFLFAFFLQRSDCGAGQRAGKAEGDEQSGSGRLPVREVPTIQL